MFSSKNDVDYLFDFPPFYFPPCNLFSEIRSKEAGRTRSSADNPLVSRPI